MDRNYKEIYYNALALAAVAHKGQTRKYTEGVPYIVHPIRVADQFKDWFMKTIAILHDTIEDTWVTYDTIRDRYGVEVADVVQVLTHQDGEKYIDYIKRIAKHTIASTIKMADIIDNLTDNPRERQIKKYNDALDILDFSRKED